MLCTNEFSLQNTGQIQSRLLCLYCSLYMRYKSVVKEVEMSVTHLNRIQSLKRVLDKGSGYWLVN